jgi:hypothetical protein
VLRIAREIVVLDDDVSVGREGRETLERIAVPMTRHLEHVVPERRTIGRDTDGRPRKIEHVQI